MVMTLLSHMIDRVLRAARDRRGVVSVEWIILAAVIMAAIVLAFAPAFKAALTAAVGAISTQLTTQVNSAGS